jgi:hypothetical protein
LIICVIEFTGVDYHVAKSMRDMLSDVD